MASAGHSADDTDQHAIAPMDSGEISPEDAERLASAFRPSWELDEGSFSAGPLMSAEEMAQLGSPQSAPTLAVSVPVAAEPVSVPTPSSSPQKAGKRSKAPVRSVPLESDARVSVGPRLPPARVETHEAEQSVEVAPGTIEPSPRQRQLTIPSSQRLLEDQLAKTRIDPPRKRMSSDDDLRALRRSNKGIYVVLIGVGIAAVVVIVRTLSANSEPPAPAVATTSTPAPVATREEPVIPAPAPLPTTTANTTSTSATPNAVVATTSAPAPTPPPVVPITAMKPAPVVAAPRMASPAAQRAIARPAPSPAPAPKPAAKSASGIVHDNPF